MTHEDKNSEGRVGRRKTAEMLFTLPPVFDLKDMESYLGMSKRLAAQTCWRWKKAGFIKSAGEQVGVYYNELKPLPAMERTKQALNKVIRIPYIVIGASAISQGGWTTQLPRTPEVGAPVDKVVRGYPTLYRAVICPRPLRWMRAVWSASSVGLDGLMTAPPAYALVDCLMAKAGMFKGGVGLWEPAPDDISIDDDEITAIQACYDAARALGAPLDMVRSYLERVSDLEDFVDEVSLEEISSPNAGGPSR